MSYKDYNSEGSSVAVRTADMTAANFDASVTAWNGLRDAIEAVTLASLQTVTFLAVVQEPMGALPVSEYARRESKWLVKYQQADGVFGSFEIPAADLTLLNGRTELMNLGAGAGLALRTAIEANVIGRDGAAVSVIEVQHVGRAT
jgi:hypothetical protein